MTAHCVRDRTRLGLERHFGPFTTASLLLVLLLNLSVGFTDERDRKPLLPKTRFRHNSILMQRGAGSKSLAACQAATH